MAIRAQRGFVDAVERETEKPVVGNGWRPTPCRMAVHTIGPETHGNVRRIGRLLVDVHMTGHAFGGYAGKFSFLLTHVAALTVGRRVFAGKGESRGRVMGYDIPGSPPG